jgi:Fic family protein
MDDAKDALRKAITRADALRAEIDALRPLEPDALGRAMQRLRLEWTYHSNAIEGNLLDYGETRALLLHGVTAHGKPLKDHLDIRRHREVLEFLEAYVRSGASLSLADLRGMHKLLMGESYEVSAQTPDGQRLTRQERGGDYKTHPNHVRTATGEIHYYAWPEETPALMTDLMDEYTRQRNLVERGELHPIELAAALHHRLVEIHPFPDGNGRLSRILMNLVLMHAKYPPAVIRQEHRDAYFGALAQADGGDLAPFVTFVAEELATTMQLYLRALRNEPDPDAFSRRIALLRREVETAGSQNAFTRERRAELGSRFLIPLLERTSERVDQMKPLFGQVQHVAMVADAAGISRFGSEALARLRDGDWVSLRPHWQLIGLKADPRLEAIIAYEGRVGTSSFVLRPLPASSRHDYSAATIPGPDEIDRVLETAFDPVLALIEKAVRSQDAQSTKR